MQVCLFNDQYRSHVRQLLSAYNNNMGDLAEALRASMLELKGVLQQPPYAAEYADLSHAELMSHAREEHAKDCMMLTAADVLSKLTERVTHTIRLAEATSARGTDA